MHNYPLTLCPRQALGLKSGVVTTGNSLDHTEMDDTVMLENGEFYGEFKR